MQENQFEQSIKRQRTSAYLMMCKVGILLIVIRFLLRFISNIYYAFESHVLERTLRVFSAFLSEIFNISDLRAFTALKSVFVSDAFDSIVSMAISILTFVLPAVVFAKLHKNSFDTGFAIKGKIRKDIILLFCFSQLFTTAMSALSSTIYNYFFGQQRQVQSPIPGYTDGFSLFVTFIHICIFVPIVEEYVFRGVIFGTLKKHGAAFAVFASALSFAIMHADAVQANYAFAFGVLSALLYYVTGNLKTSILIHAFNNTVNLLFTYSYDWFGQQISNVIICIYTVAIAVFGVYAITLFLRKDGYLDKFKSKENESNIGQFRAGLFEILCAPVLFIVLVYAAEICYAEMFL